MADNPFDLQGLSQANADAAARMLGDWTKGWQAIAAEMTDYSKRTFEEGTVTFGQLLSARSIEQALEIQSSYAKRSYDQYAHQLSRIGAMCAELTRSTYKPLERTLQQR